MNTNELRDYFAFVQLDEEAHEWLTELNLDTPRVNLHCLSRVAQLRKRALDVATSASLLVLLSPVIAIAALLVRLTSRGPIIFRQERVGIDLRLVSNRREADDTAPADILDRRKDNGSSRRSTANFGKPFVLFKFRTMRVDAETEGAQFAVENDPRVTPVGSFLRRTRIDELPQLWNVLKGEMSMVGPRPERPQFIQELSDQIPRYVHRLRLQPGLTGVAQVLNGYDNQIDGFRRKVAYDLLYLQNACFRNDIKIMIRTVWVVLTGKGAI